MRRPLKASCGFVFRVMSNQLLEPDPPLIDTRSPRRYSDLAVVVVESTLNRLLIEQPMTPTLIHSPGEEK